MAHQATAKAAFGAAGVLVGAGASPAGASRGSFRVLLVTIQGMRFYWRTGMKRSVRWTTLLGALAALALASVARAQEEKISPKELPKAELPKFLTA